MLPYLEESSIYGTIDFEEKIANQDLTKQSLEVFRCPSDSDDRLQELTDAEAQFDWGRNSYRGNAGNDTGQMTGTGAPPEQVERNNGIFLTNKKVKDVGDH